MEKGFVYRNILENKKIYKFQMAGIVSDFIFSKELFIKNSDISIFLNVVFDLKFKDYVMKSRTLIVSRTIKKICNSDENTISYYRKQLLSFVNDNWYSDEKISSNKKNNLSEWVNGDM